MCPPAGVFRGQPPSGGSWAEMSTRGPMWASAPTCKIQPYLYKTYNVLAKGVGKNDTGLLAGKDTLQAGVFKGALFPGAPLVSFSSPILFRQGKRIGPPEGITNQRADTSVRPYGVSISSNKDCAAGASPRPTGGPNGASAQQKAKGPTGGPAPTTINQARIKIPTYARDRREIYLSASA